jgi:very-short-patch-repair endonuclease
VDFVCHKKKCVVELDGGHHLEQVAYDEERSRFLNAQGFVVLRFWNNEVFKETESVLGKILTCLEQI